MFSVKVEQLFDPSGMRNCRSSTACFAATPPALVSNVFASHILAESIELMFLAKHSGYSQAKGLSSWS